MFPGSFNAMTGRPSMTAALAGAPASGASPSTAEEAEFKAEVARWAEAAKTDPELEGMMRREFLRTGKEVHRARAAVAAWDASPRARELQRMFPNSYASMVSKKGDGR